MRAPVRLSSSTGRARGIALLPWFVAGLAAAAHAEDPRRSGLAAYLELGVRYRAGDTEGAVGELLRWRTAEVDEAVHALLRRSDGLRACADSPEAIEATTVESLVLLHLDAVRRLSPNAPPSRSALGHEADTARRLLEAVRFATQRWRNDAAAPGGCAYRPRITRHDFCFTLAGFLLGRSQPEDALLAANAGLAADPDDTDLLLAAACAHELRSLISGMVRATPTRPTGDWGPAGAGARQYEYDTRAAQDVALAFLKRILRIDPHVHAARLRRGRLLWLQRHYAEAEAELRLAAEAPEPQTRYLAELFLGGAREEQADAKGALEAYRRANDAWPQAQTARLALARLTLLAGHAEEARSQVLEPLGRPWSTDLHEDPWWQYPFGTWPEAERLFERLRRRVAEN